MDDKITQTSDNKHKFFLAAQQRIMSTEDLFNFFSMLEVLMPQATEFTKKMGIHNGTLEQLIDRETSRLSVEPLRKPVSDLKEEVQSGTMEEITKVKPQNENSSDAPAMSEEEVKEKLAKAEKPEKKEEPKKEEVVKSPKAD